MITQELMDEILPIIYSIKDDNSKLQMILDFLHEEIYIEPDFAEEVELPDKYKKVVSEIADSIECGFVCFLNVDTLESEEFPKEMLNDPEEFEAMTGQSIKSLESKHTGWKKYITFEPLDSFEDFQIMKQFTNLTEDERLQNRLTNALESRKPFANFINILDNTEHLHLWYKFKKQYMRDHVKEMLLLGLGNEYPEFLAENKKELPDEVENFKSIKVALPYMCVICKTYNSPSGQENSFCQKNRFDQRNDEDFACGAFEKN